MKKSLLVLLLATFSIASFGQFKKVTVTDIQHVEESRLKACIDSSLYFGDTVTFTCRVIADGNLVEVPSSSVQDGFRPFVHVVDTAKNSTMGGFRGVQVMGVYRDSKGNSLPVKDVFNLYAGMEVEITGVVSAYQGETQVSVLNNSSLKVISTGTAPSAITVDLGKLNDETRTNQIVTGEEYEGSFVKIEDLTVTAVYNFSGNRVSFDLTDDDGNVINVSDRFLVQKTKSYTTSRPTAPYSQGKFEAPVVGTRFDHIMGIIVHSNNGCTGNSGRGYEINPFDESHYLIGITPPSVTEIERNPLVPTDADDATISAKVVDFDGEVIGVELYYSDDISKSASEFTKMTMAVKSGTTDEFEATIPKAADGTIIRYYIKAEDDDGQFSHVPFGAKDPKNPDFMFYSVRNSGLTIVDLQQVLNLSRDRSPYENQEVTVTGVVTSSAKAYDLELIYIQDENAKEFAGIQCVGNSDLIKLYRGQSVTVTGTVSESFGHTVLNVTNVTNTGNVVNIDPVILDINDTAWFTSREAEKYEGMLIGFANPGGKVTVSDGQLNPFGEWTVGATENASFNRSVRIQSGIQNNNNHSSLWVSVVSDTTLKDNEGVMNVDPIAAQKGMTFDTIVGINFYGFSNYKIHPRNNDDLRGSSVELSATDYPAIVNSVPGFDIGSFNLYPNPVRSSLNISSQVEGLDSWLVRITNLDGRTVLETDMDRLNSSIDLESLQQGLYMISILSADGMSMIGSSKIVKH